MMRYQRVSPDCAPLSNGKKPSPKTTTTTSCNGNGIGNGENGVSTSGTEGGFGKALRFRTPSHSPPQSDPPPPPPPPPPPRRHESSLSLSPSPSPSPNRGDVLLQWGQKKRTRVSRAEIRSLTDESSSTSSANKLHRRMAPASALVSKATSMPPPPPPPPPPASTCRTANLRNSLLSSKDGSRFIHDFTNRNFEERSGAGNGSPSRNSAASNRAVSRSVTGKRSPPTPEKNDKKIASSGSVKDEKPNGSLSQADHLNRVDSASVQSEQGAGAANTGSVAGGGGEKGNVEVIEWPRIYLALSRKEKEDDFLAMKGTKLPQRPKKRAKNIDRALQYCFPGMWLSDLTKGRYEVREKKCVKKQQKRRGLKGMESMESDSD
ncbi:DUF1639 domain-containing protein [Cephalotus follicularis]|uniref:DUF1639 domain-containing protein n=1 Tax=Cephalotus follicularis TaxID=3775 RepID=A0A1Q3BTQ4_CEPFO|nr:DUF1639 domain-containing protein [Cephalotus follicularis]